MMRQATAADAEELADLMRAAISAASEYTDDERRAWRSASTSALVRDRLLAGQGWLIEDDGVASFGICIGDLVDLLYTRPDAMRQGHATRILQQFQRERPYLQTEASRLSAPVFERAGFRSLGGVERRLSGCTFVNEAMEWDRRGQAD